MSSPLPAPAEVAVMRADRLRGRVVVLDCPDARSASELEAEIAGDCTFASSSWRRACELRRHDATRHVVHAATAPADGAFDGALVFVPKGRARVQWALATTASALKPGSEVLLVGHKKAGVASAAKHLKRLVGPTDKLLSARHCMLFAATVVEDREPWSGGELWWEHGDLEIAAPPGVFSAGRMDDGTAMLLSVLPQTEGRALDLGCGAGVIAAVLARQGAGSVVAVDDDAVALAATRDTIARNQLAGRVHVHASDGFRDVDGRFHLIATNPPFHDGVATTDEAAQRFVADAAGHLESCGELVIVGNRFLRYPVWLDQAFRRWDVLAEDGRFRVYRAAARDARSR